MSVNFFSSVASISGRSRNFNIGEGDGQENSWGLGIAPALDPLLSMEIVWMTFLTANFFFKCQLNIFFSSFGVRQYSVCRFVF